MTKHIALLEGGLSCEREISLLTAEAVYSALCELGYKVTRVDAGRDLAEVLAKIKPDLAFNALHGEYGEDGCIQGLLEFMGIPYTHSGVTASAIAMDKVISRNIFMQNGLKCPKAKVIHKEELRQGEPMPRPFVIKPISEGSSVGVYIFFEDDDWCFDLDEWKFGDKILVEEYIKGQEINIAVMGDKALGALEIKPLTRFYDYEAKYTEGKAEHIMPANLPPDVYKRALEIGLKAHNALGCKGVSRAEAIYNKEEDEFYMIEVNTQPGMTKLSLLPEIAKYTGVSFNELVDFLVKEI